MDEAKEEVAGRGSPVCGSGACWMLLVERVVGRMGRVVVGVVAKLFEVGVVEEGR